MTALETSAVSDGSAAAIGAPKLEFRRGSDIGGSSIGWTLTLGESLFEDVVPTRAFPLSDPTRWISIRDSEGKELTFLNDLDSLDPVSRETLLAALDECDGTPTILRLEKIIKGREESEWIAWTDRGRGRFVLKAGQNARRLDDGRFSLVDSRGGRLFISPLAKLDSRSRRLLDVVLD